MNASGEIVGARVTVDDGQPFVATNPHAASSGRDSWKHKHAAKVSGRDLCLIDIQGQCSRFHRDGDLEFAGANFLGANEMRSLMSVHDVKMWGAMVEPKSPTALVIAECGDDSVFVGWAINDGRHREATKH